MSTPPPSDTQPIPFSLAVFGVPLTPELVAACRLVKDACAATSNESGKVWLADFVAEVLATAGK